MSHFNPFEDSHFALKEIISRDFKYDDTLRMISVLSNALLNNTGLYVACAVLSVSFNLKKTLSELLFEECETRVTHNMIDLQYEFTVTDIDVTNIHQLTELLEFCVRHLQHTNDLNVTIDNFNLSECINFIAVMGFALKNEISFDEAYETLGAHITVLRTGGIYPSTKRHYTALFLTGKEGFSVQADLLTRCNKRLAELKLTQKRRDLCAAQIADRVKGIQEIQ